MSAACEILSTKRRF